jgi:hypothetical protein
MWKGGGGCERPNDVVSGSALVSTTTTPSDHTVSEKEHRPAESKSFSCLSCMAMCPRPI